MNALSIILNIVLILISLVLVAVVLMQQGQSRGLGAISGGAETFFGKGKARSLDAKLQKITKIAAVAFIILAIATTMIVAHINNDAQEAALEAALESGEAHMHEDGTVHYGEHVEETAEVTEETTEEAAEATEEAAETTEEAAETTEEAPVEEAAPATEEAAQAE